MHHGSNIDPPNRFESVHHELDLEHLEWDQEHLRTLANRPIEYIADASKTIVSENNSAIPGELAASGARGGMELFGWEARQAREKWGVFRRVLQSS